jgi:hypothetical protein
MRRWVVTAFVLVASLPLVLAAEAMAVTITPPSWDFGTVKFSDDEQTARSATQTFTVAGQAGDDFTVGFANGSNADFVRSAQNCVGVHITNGVTCTVSVHFAPTQDGFQQDFLRVGYWMQPGNLVVEKAVAQLTGTGVDLLNPDGERGGRGTGKKNCKKIKNKKKRKKCLKKQKGGGGGRSAAAGESATP